MAVFLILAGIGAYAVHEHVQAGRLATQNSEMAASLNNTRSQIDALMAKINALTTPPPEKPAPSRVANQRATTRPVRHHARTEDPRGRELRSQLAQHQKEIESTQQDLSNTRTELQGSIARTHDELVVLQKRGERSYYEFDLDKSGQFQREGPVGVRLRKANTKHEYADLELIVDDYKLSKKHVNVYEPVMFYNADNGRPVEIVINSISKNHIHGYVSEPKYKSSELDAMVSSGGAATGKGEPSPAPRQRLPLSKPDNSHPN